MIELSRILRPSESGPDKKLMDQNGFVADSGALPLRSIAYAFGFSVLLCSMQEQLAA